MNAPAENAIPLPVQRRHMPGLDGLRGLAILVVLIHHFTPAVSGSAMTRSMLEVAHTGWIGVDLFFVLSGFLITGILLDTRHTPGYFRNFFARRTLRIAPVYYGTLAVVFGLVPLLVWMGWRSETVVWLFGKTADELAVLSEHQGWLWTYLTNFKIGYDQTRWGVVNHFWSLAVEEHFYLVWPFVVYFCSRRALLWVCGACIIGAPVLRGVLVFMGFDSVVPYVLTPTRVDSLAWGGLVAVLVRSAIAGHLPKLAITAAIGSAVLLIAIAGGYGRFHRDDTLTTILGYTLLAMLFASFTFAASGATRTSPLGRVLCQRWLMSLGKYSYGIYVLHHFLQVPAQKLFPWSSLTALTGSYLYAIIVHAVLAIAMSWAVAWVVFHAFEKHFLRLKDRFEYRVPVRTPVPIATPAPIPAPKPAVAA